MTLKEFYNIFQNIKNLNIFNNIFSKIYLFLRGMFLFAFWIINFAVPQIFQIIKSDFPDFKKIKNHLSIVRIRSLRGLVWIPPRQIGPRATCARRILPIFPCDSVNFRRLTANRGETGQNGQLQAERFHGSLSDFRSECVCPRGRHCCSVSADRKACFHLRRARQWRGQLKCIMKSLNRAKITAPRNELRARAAGGILILKVD